MRVENADYLITSTKAAITAVAMAGTRGKSGQDAYYVVCTAIHWIMDCIDRIPMDEVRSEHRKVFSAVRYANNCLKHSRIFVGAHELKGFGYPHDYPHDYGTWYVWIDILSENEKFNNQKQNYENELVGKNVFNTMKDIMDILEEFYY